jgi:hypothetical protein
MSKERLTVEEMLEQAVKEYYTKPDAKDGIWDFTKNEVLYAMQSFAAQEVNAAIAERMPTDREILMALDIPEPPIEMRPYEEELIVTGVKYATKYIRSRMDKVSKECPSPKSKDGKHLSVSSDPEGNYCGLCGKDLNITGGDK